MPVSDDILFAPIREQAGQIKDGKLSPVELTDAYLDRLEKLGPELNAVGIVMRHSRPEEPKAAAEEVRAGPYRGPLHGIPYGATDLRATKGVPTSWGAEPCKDQVVDYDATVITKLREAGAILCAKLGMVE